MLELILKITICHLLGDFVLQTNKMIEGINTNKLKSKYLYRHAFFLLDQGLHIISISLFIKYFYNYEIDYSLIFNNRNYLFLISIICIVFVSGILIKKILEIFSFDMDTEGLKNAGYYIGVLERLFVFVFVITSFWEGIGFLLAAKSIFRFGDLKENKEIKLTEYILIGTLLSFGIAILIGKIFLFFSSVLSN